MYSMKGTGEISDGLLSENEAAFGGGIMVQDNTELFIKGGTNFPKPGERYRWRLLYLAWVTATSDRRFLSEK